MGNRHRAFVLLLSLQCATGCAQTTEVSPIRRQAGVPAERQLRGLGAEEARLLIAQLKDAQSRLRAGEFQGFELMTGSIASSPTARVSPLDAFLAARFDEVWNIERLRPDSRPLPTYRLAYAPNGLGQLYWDIEVTMGVNNGIERVEMTYRSPAPF